MHADEPQPTTAADASKQETAMHNLAERKLARLHERGYRQVAIVMTNDHGKCVIVSELGRVTWHDAATAHTITGPASAPQPGCNTDTQRIEELERLVQTNHELRLHNGVVNRDCIGLVFGVRSGRTLRNAIDASIEMWAAGV